MLLGHLTESDSDSDSESDSESDSDSESESEDEEETNAERIVSERERLISLRHDSAYKSKYGVGRLPSLVALTEDRVIDAFSELATSAVDIGILEWVDGVLRVFDLSMKKACLFAKTDSKMTPIVRGPIGEMARVLDEDETSTNAEDAADKKEVEKALKHLKVNNLFTLPSNPAVSSLARYFLAPTEVTKKHLFVLLNVAAGASAFGKLSIASLVDGAYPVLNEQALTLLGYENGPPPDANHLLKRFRDKLEGNSSMPYHGGRTMLRDVFEAILADFVLKQDLGVWREIDDTSVGESVPVVAASEHRSVYFSLDAERGRERRRRAIFALYSVVTSRFTYLSRKAPASWSSFGSFGFPSPSMLVGSPPPLRSTSVSSLSGRQPPPTFSLPLPYHGGRTMLRDVFEAILADFVLKQDLGVWREIDDTSVGESVPVVAASEHRSVYFSLDAERGRERRRRAIFALYATAASRFTYLSTNRRVEYGHHGGFASLLYQNSLDSSFRQGRVIMDAKTYSVDLTAVGANSHDDDVKHMDDVFTRLRTLIKKADDGSGKTKWSFSDDIPVLFDLGTTEEGEMDEVLRVFGYSEDDDEDEDDELGFITKDEGVVCSDDDGDENDNSRSEDED
eukprot:CAMPEP_0185825594 /NCGR_PEP_ID=MMETSP1322-20130828/31121_1 /TAXON_ID=265543 /ORGANISM="Minutocellus polymorphus, Strain RCC2270" /LENGTH=622 /DNA_ID=CAMNT_0028523317 /DNA_START=301 /DNA_END=2170 /DNA_ORIENTATION=+